MLRAWIKQLVRFPKNGTFRKKSSAKKARFCLEQLEDRFCPSTTTVDIVDGASFGPYDKGTRIHMDISVDSNDSQELDEGTEFVTVTSTGGFSAQVPEFVTQSFDWTATQDGETFSVSTEDSDETGTIDVTDHPPFLDFSVQPQDGVPTEILPPVTVQVTDENGAPITDFSGNVTLTFNPNFSADATMKGTLTQPVVNGEATFDDLFVTKSGKQFFLTASLDDGSGTQATSDYFSAFNTIKLRQQPEDSFANEALNPITVEVDRPDGSVDNGFQGQIQVAIANNPPGDGQLIGTTTVDVQADGTATFDNIAIDKNGVGYTLNFSVVDDPTVQVESNAFNVGHFLDFTKDPTDAAPKQDDPVEVTLKNPDGTNDTSLDGQDLTLTLNDFGGGGTLAGNTATWQDGVASFPNLSVSKAGFYSLTASISDDSLLSAEFHIFDTLSFKVQPSNAEKTPAVISPAVVVEADRPDGQVDTNFTDPVNIQIFDNPSDGHLSGTTPVDAQSGLATFSDLSIDTNGAGYTLEAFLDDGTEVISDTFNIGHFLKFTGQPTDVAPKQDDHVTVLLENPNGTPDDSLDGQTLTLTLNDDFGSGGQLAGNTATIANGLADFPNLTVSKSGSYSLTAQIGDTTAETSNDFSVFDTLSFKVQPSDTVVGKTINPAVEVDVLRPDGQVDANFTGNVDMAIGEDASSDSGAKLSGTIPVAAQAGIATFSDLSIDEGGQGYSLMASLDDGTEEFSNAFNVSHVLAFNQQPSDVLARDTVTPPVTVQVLNADGAVDTNFSGTVDIAIDTNPNNGKLSGTTTVEVSNGVATFDDLNIDQKGVGYTIEATTDDGGDITSNAFDVTDIKAREITFADPTGMDYNYLISGGKVPKDVPGALYWSSTASFDEADATIVDGTQFTIPQGTQAQNDPFTGHVSESLLQKPPKDAKFLLLVVGDPNAAYFDPDVNVKALALPNVSADDVEWNNDAAEVQKTDTTQRNRINYDYSVADQSLVQSAQGQFYWSNFTGADPSTINAANWKSFVVGADPASPLIDLQSAEDEYSMKDPARWGLPPDTATGILFVVDPNNKLIEANKDDNFDFLKLHTAKELLTNALNVQSVNSSIGIVAMFQPGGSTGAGGRFNLGAGGQFTLSEAETRFGVDHFNWVQYVTVPSNWTPETLGSIDRARVISDITAAGGGSGLKVTSNGLIAYNDTKTGQVIQSQYAIGDTFLDPIVQAGPGQDVDSVTRAFLITQAHGAQIAEAWMNDPGVPGTAPNPDNYYYYLRENENQEWAGVENPDNVTPNSLFFGDQPVQLNGAFANSPAGHAFLAFSTQLVGVNYDLDSYKSLTGVDPSVKTGFTWQSNTVQNGTGSISNVTLIGGNNLGGSTTNLNGDVSNVHTTDNPADLPKFAAPTSSVATLPVHSPSKFTVSWSGTPGTGVSGIAAYSIFVSDNGGPIQPFLLNTTKHSAQFTVPTFGHTYSFFSVATDTDGGVEVTPTIGDATTTADVVLTTHFNVIVDTKVVTGNPPSVLAGTPFKVTLQALDQHGKVDTTFRGTVDFSCTDLKVVGIPPSLTFSAADNGQIMTTVTFKTAGKQTVKIVDASDNTIHGPTLAITVKPGKAVALMVTGFPTNDIAGKSHTITVKAVDSFGNTDPTYTGTVTITSTDKKATLPKAAALKKGIGTFKVTLNTVTMGTTTFTLTATGIDKSKKKITGKEVGIQVAPAVHAGVNSAAIAFSTDFATALPDPNPLQSPELGRDLFGGTEYLADRAALLALGKEFAKIDPILLARVRELSSTADTVRKTAIREAKAAGANSAVSKLFANHVLDHFWDMAEENLAGEIAADKAELSKSA